MHSLVVPLLADATLMDRQPRTCLQGLNLSLYEYVLMRPRRSGLSDLLMLAVPAHLIRLVRASSARL